MWQCLSPEGLELSEAPRMLLLPIFTVNPDTTITRSSLGETRWLCYVRHWNCTAPGTPVPTYFNSGPLGSGCSDKAQAEAPGADKAHELLTQLRAASASWENWEQFGSFRVRLTLGTAAGNSNQNLLPLLSKPISSAAPARLIFLRLSPAQAA